MIHDFDNRPIKIKKEGPRYPIDIMLTERDGENILHISADIYFLLPDYYESVYSTEALRIWQENILAGFRCWAGEYKVFGNQSIRVEMEIQEKNHPLDAVVITTIQEHLQRKLSYLNKEKRKKWMNRYLAKRRDCAVVGKNWTAASRKTIFFRDTSIKSPQTVKNVAKHEFGHCIGLGDMYRDPASGYLGIRRPDYRDIQSFFMQDYQYNLVMCNNGEISDNDIEMVLLAFSENKMQHYQTSMFDKEQVVSRALGRGN